MLPNPQFPPDWVTFTEEILNGKLHFLFRGWSFELFNILSTDQGEKSDYQWIGSILILKNRFVETFVTCLILFKDISISQENVDFVLNESFSGKKDPNVNDCELNNNDEHGNIM